MKPEIRELMRQVDPLWEARIIAQCILVFQAGSTSHELWPEVFTEADYYPLDHP